MFPLLLGNKTQVEKGGVVHKNIMNLDVKENYGQGQDNYQLYNSHVLQELKKHELGDFIFWILKVVYSMESVKATKSIK